MKAKRLDWRRSLVAGWGLALLITCTSAPEPSSQGHKQGQRQKHKQYEDWHELMEHEMRPIQGAFADQLTKDPQDADYTYLGDHSRKAAYYFGLFSDRTDMLYDTDAEVRASAEKARKWLLEMAGAADRKDHGTLVRLMGQRKQMCSQCHEDKVR